MAEPKLHEVGDLVNELLKKNKMRLVDVVKAVCADCGSELEIEKQELKDGILTVEVGSCRKCVSGGFKLALESILAALAFGSKK